ncbi:MAG: hypothetical protein ABI591_18310 [Kofleriaceae bacterium]
MVKRLPLALVIGLVVQALFDSARVVHFSHPSSWESWSVFEEAFDFGTSTLITFGLFDLARGLRGHAALGARIAAWAQLAGVVMLATWLGLILWSNSGHESGAVLKNLDLATRYLEGLSVLATTIGLWMVSRNVALGLAGVVIAVIGVPVPVVADLIHGHLSLGETSAMLITFLPFALLSVIWLAQILVGARFVEMPPPAVPASFAFTRAANAVWLMVIARCALSGLTFFAALSGGIGMLDLLKGVTLLSPIIEVVALLLFARAAIQLGRAGISPWRTTLAGLCALLTMGGIAGQLPTTYSLLYGSHDFGGEASSMVTYAVTVALLAAAAFTLVMLAVGQLARDRNAEDVRENVAIRTGVFVVLSLGSLFVATYGMSRLPPSRGLILFILLAMVAASFYALALAAKICAQGAELVERDPVGLPSATLIQRGDS